MPVKGESLSNALIVLPVACVEIVASLGRVEGMGRDEEEVIYYVEMMGNLYDTSSNVPTPNA